MAKKISSKDIFQDEDIFKGIKKSAKETIDMMKALKKEVEKTAKQMKSGFGAKPSMDSSKNIEKIVKVTAQANKLKKEAIQIDKLHSQAVQQEARATQELEKIEQQKIRTKQQQMRLSSQERKEKERLQKVEERRKKTLADESNAYKRLVKETRRAKNESKRLGAEMLNLEKAGKKNTQEYKKLSQAYNQMTRSAKQGDQALKKLDKSVGDNFRNVGNYKGAIQGLVSTLGTLGAGIGIGQIFRNVTGIMIDFDQAQADLSAISGKTKQELSGLTAQAKELGATTQFSATQITEMQIELSKLGFTTKQVEQSTQAVSNFASATGSDIASASKVAGNALRAFGLEAYEMERVVSVLGVATTKSALSFEDYQTAISSVAPVAKSFGFSIEDTTSLLAQLKNAGFDASKASIATRNIILKMADANGELAKALGRPIKNLEDLATGFRELEEGGLDLAKALELTDQRSVSAFKVFTENADKLVGFRDSITGVSGELQEMADKKLDSVRGQLTLLSSAWEGFILGVNDSTGASESLKNAIGFLAENLSEIMNVVITLTRVWLTYQAVTKGQLLINRLMATSFMQTAKNMKGLKGVAMRVRGAFTSLGKAIKNNLGGIALVLIADLVMKMKKLSDVANTTARNMEELSEAQAQVTANAEKEKIEIDALFTALKKTNATSVERKNLIDEINSRYGTTLQNLSNEEDFVIQVDQAYQDLMKTMQAKADLEGARVGFEVTQRQKVEMKTELEKMMQILQPKYFVSKAGDQFMKARPKVVGGTLLSNWANSVFASIFGTTDYQSVAQQYNILVDQYNATLTRAEAYKKDYTDKLASFSALNTTTRTSTPAPTPAPSSSTTPTTPKEYDTSLKEIQEYNSQYFKLQKQRRENDEKERQRAVNDNFRGEIMNAIKRAENIGEAEGEVQERLFAEEIQRRKDFLKEETELEITDARETLKQKQLNELNALQKEFEEKKKKIPRWRRAERKELDTNGKKRLQELQSQQALEREDLKLSIKLKREMLVSSLKDLDEQLKEQNGSFNDAIHDALVTFADAQATAIEEAMDDEATATANAIARRKLIFQQMNDFVQLSTQIFIDASNRRIEQLDKEIDMAERNYDLFKNLAIQGNIDAEQSLAEQQRIIDEANRKKLEEEKRQQRLRLAESVFNTYNAKIQAGSNPTEAIAQTIADTSVLLQFIQSIPAFFEGTEDTGKHGEGVDGKGGFHAILHPNERVIPKSLNDQIGKLTNEELTRMAVNYKNGVTLEGANQTASALDLALVVNELSSIKETIKNKPETNIEMGEITSSMMEIVHKTKKGNSVTFNRYKVKK